MSDGANLYYTLSENESRRFRKILLDNLTRSASLDTATNDTYDGIGRLGEKQMHSALKYFICPDETCHEVKIQNSPLYIQKEENTKNRKYVADILNGDTIYEIQTGGFAPLEEKIKWILDNTSYRVVVIHPIAQTKWVSKIDENGNISPRRKSSRKGRLENIAGELYFFRHFLSSPRFSLMVVMMEAEQYVKTKKQSRRAKKYELIPISLLGVYLFKNAADYSYFIPDSLPDTFTVKQYSEHTKIKGIDAYSITRTLCGLGLLSEGETCGRARTYQKISAKKQCVETKN
ncbi:MAG: hypothetical protein E7667_03450 [Ruminococcaceae bacterium]|nr:hypothetical protein [Oscillospiraceae bacterium]